MKRGRQSTYSPNSTYFLTTTVVHRMPIFRSAALAGLFLSDLAHYVLDMHVDLHGYVLMPTHVHLLATFGPAGQVSSFMGRLKEHSAKQILQWCHENNRVDLLQRFHDSALMHKRHSQYQVWEPRFDDLTIFNEDTFKIKLQYIHSNPLQEHWSLCSREEDYPYSSAGFYAMGKTSRVPLAKQ
jgi:putative transposase